MSQKIIFFDIDGTLYDHDKKLPASTGQAIRELQERGHEVAIATGRAPFMFEGLRKELGIETFVSYNGQYVVFKGEPLYKNPLNKEALLRLTDVAVERKHPVVFMDHEDMKANTPEHEHVTTGISSLKINYFPEHDPTYHEGRDLYQSLLFCQDPEDKEYEKAFPEFDFVRWHPVSVDIVPAGGSKAKGIQKVIDKLGILPEDIYAFGDGLNDVEMLKMVANSVAMGDGHPEAVNAAKHVTTNVDADGILNGLKMVGLLD
ncbi:Cof-type HAD-IIB family hydrolase [Domibacillus indicus]|uniref:Cof-type HAD-IIB family hydrolase n=1 Tax=Domibacillus indicus TaxID=1437523 RepID=UPI002040A4DC|nr:Cof-type HAD-IIB family hydrolase [Domibacillus indicus]MCM3788723.1 Cof-type HAD-IIB family hydrolase [Domibacillus indicus]